MNVPQVDSYPKFLFMLVLVIQSFHYVLTLRIDAITIYNSVSGLSIKDGIINVKTKTQVDLLLCGSNVSSTWVSFGLKLKDAGENCYEERIFEPITSNEKGIVSLSFDESWGGKVLYLCARSENITWLYQGRNAKINVEKTSIHVPLGLQICFIIILMLLSGLTSGLNLGLMSLDPNDLEIVMRSGTKQQKKYAKKILPVRKHGNYLLCTLLLGNTLINVTFTILLDDLTNGMFAVIVSTLVIVILGEVIPQSLCARYGLAAGAYTIWLTKILMFLTFPISYPVGKTLDYLLGNELGTIYNKSYLLEMLKLQNEYNDLEQDEVEIIHGALNYKAKTVEEIMTPLDDCFLLNKGAVLDFKTMSEILRSGYSRIPVYSENRSNIVALLFTKDLAFVDPDDCVLLSNILNFYNHPVHKVYNDTTLDKALEVFKQGTTHLSVILKQKRGEDTKKEEQQYECIGIVTLEDIIEEIIQAEIVDETDIYVDNVSMERVKREHCTNYDFSFFLSNQNESKKHISPHLVLAVFQYLSSSVDVFREEFISKKNLKKLIELPGVIEVLEVDPEERSKGVFLYKKGCNSDFFVLLIQGRVEVVVGSEDILFEDGPFSTFGVGALMYESGQQFTPDYTVKLLTPHAQYLKISRNMYKSAVRTTKKERLDKLQEKSQEFDEMFWSNLKRKSATPSLAPDTPSNIYSDLDSIQNKPSYSKRKKSSGTNNNTPIEPENKNDNNDIVTKLIRCFTPNYDREGSIEDDNERESLLNQDLDKKSKVTK